jgi:phage host-nuclease inhibitor protein Gam
MRGINERILKLENKCDEIKAEVAKDAQTNREMHMMLRNAIDGLATRIERLENTCEDDKISIGYNYAQTAEGLHALEAQIVQLDWDFSGKLSKAGGYGLKHADKLEKLCAEIKDLKKTMAACASDDVPGKELVDTLD